MGGTRGIGVVIAPSGIERKSFFFLIRQKTESLLCLHVVKVISGGKGRDH